MKYPHHAIAHQSLESIEDDECKEPNNDTIARRFRTLFNEIERLQEAKRRALAIADERSKENVLLRKALEQIRDDMLCDPKDVAENALIDVGTPTP
jgi:hypothetical protein